MPHQASGGWRQTGRILLPHATCARCERLVALSTARIVDPISPAFDLGEGAENGARQCVRDAGDATTMRRGGGWRIT